MWKNAEKKGERYFPHEYFRRLFSEGRIKPDPMAWVGERFSGYIIQDEYKGRTKNKIGEIKPYVGFNNPDVQAAAKNDTVPF